jgi:glycerol uptake facilitator-like aquaporin
MDSEGQTNFKSEIQDTIRDSLLILIFEFLGTMLLTLLYCNCEELMDTCGFFIGVYILIIFSAKISGSHFNPAITLAFMFRRDIGRFNRLLGIAYMIFQLGGAITGALVSYILVGTLPNLVIKES